MSNQDQAFRHAFNVIKATVAKEKAPDDAVAMAGAFIFAAADFFTQLAGPRITESALKTVLEAVQKKGKQ